MRTHAAKVALAAILMLICSFQLYEGTAPVAEAFGAPGAAAFTHSVLCELFALSSDAASADAEAAMAGFEGTYGHDFHFVTILADVYDADGRGSYYNILTQPTLEFDGGFIEDISGTLTGAGQGGALVEACAQRPVQVVKMAVFIDEKNITVKMMYESAPALPVSLPVELPGIVPFQGRLRAYVCEKNSSVAGAPGKPAPNAVIGIALDEDVSLAQGQWAERTIQHGYGENISNINVVAGIFEMYGGIAEVPKLSTCVQSACSDETSGENSPPEITNIYTSPKYPASTDSITVYATVTDDKKVMSVNLAYCQNEVCKSPAPMVSEGNNVYSFSLGIFSDGTKVRFNIKAEDSEGESYQTPERYFIVGSDDLPPVCEIKSPKSGTLVSGQLVIKGIASDDKGVQKVEVKIGELDWEPAEGTDNWTYSPDTSKLASGAQKARARSYDGSQYSEEHIITVKIAGNSSGQIPSGGAQKDKASVPEQFAVLAPVACAAIASAVILARRRI